MASYHKVFSVCLLSLSSLFANEDWWDGDEYATHSDLQYQWATNYLSKLHLEGTERILDIGCGDGRVTAFIAKSLPRGSVVGIDPSDSMLQAAHAQMALPNLQFLKRDATQLDFEREFDYVVSFSCLHWIFDHFAVLQGIERALRPGGKVFLYFAADYECNRLDHAIDAIVASPKWTCYFTDFVSPCFLITPSQFAHYAKEAGLTLKRMDQITVDETFPDKSAFVAWMAAWMPQLKRLPQELHQVFIEEVIDYYLEKRPSDPKDAIHYVGYWLEVELQG